MVCVGVGLGPAVGVLVGNTGVLVFVAVGGIGVSVRVGVLVRLTVAVGRTGVFVGVLLGATVFVGGTGVLVFVRVRVGDGVFDGVTVGGGGGTVPT